MSYTEITIENSKIKIYEKYPKQPKQPHPTLNLVSSLSKNNGKAGVYVWGFYDRTATAIIFHPLYVGKAGNLFGRLINHYCCLRGGAYQMFDATKKIIYQPICFNDIGKSDIIHYPQPTNILDNFTFRYVELASEGKRIEGEKYLTKIVLERLCKPNISDDIKLKNVLLSGAKGWKSSKLELPQLAEMIN